MIRSLFVGITEANRNWKMILSLLAANILLSFPLIVPIFLLIIATSGGTLAADRMMANNVDVFWLMDLFNHQFTFATLESVATQIGALLIAAGLVNVLLNTLFAGGIIGVFNSTDGLFSMRKFWGEAGAFFGRFFRLMLISLIFYGAAIGIYALMIWPIESAAKEASAIESIVYKRWTAIALLVLMIALVNMVFDYAKIGTVVRSDKGESKGMFRETFHAIRFAARNFFIAFGLYLIIALIGLTLFLVFNYLRWAVIQSSIGKALFALLMGQIVIVCQMWTRLVFYAAQTHLFKKLAPIITSSPVISEPPLEFARAEAPYRDLE